MANWPLISEILKGGRDFRELLEALPPPQGAEPLIEFRRRVESKVGFPSLEFVEDKAISAFSHLEHGLGLRR